MWFNLPVYTGTEKHIDDKHNIDDMIYDALFVIDPLSLFVLFDHVHIV